MGTTWNILVVDDDATERGIVVRALAAGGVAAEVVELDNGADAISAATEV